MVEVWEFHKLTEYVAQSRLRQCLPVSLLALQELNRGMGVKLLKQPIIPGTVLMIPVVRFRVLESFDTEEEQVWILWYFSGCSRRQPFGFQLNSTSSKRGFTERNNLDLCAVSTSGAIWLDSRYRSRSIDQTISFDRRRKHYKLRSTPTAPYKSF